MGPLKSNKLGSTKCEYVYGERARTLLKHLWKKLEARKKELQKMKDEKKKVKPSAEEENGMEEEPRTEIKASELYITRAHESNQQPLSLINHRWLLVNRGGDVSCAVYMGLTLVVAHVVTTQSLDYEKRMSCPSITTSTLEAPRRAQANGHEKRSPPISPAMLARAAVPNVSKPRED